MPRCAAGWAAPRHGACGPACCATRHTSWAAASTPSSPSRGRIGTPRTGSPGGSQPPKRTRECAKP
eukprot:7095948-Lingulodinium_polyedra.AAC.1